MRQQRVQPPATATAAPTYVALLPASADIQTRCLSDDTEARWQSSIKRTVTGKEAPQRRG